MQDNHKKFMLEAIRLSQEGMQKGAGGPFGCVIVKDGEIVGSGHNRVTSTNDPTAHAEVVAIRDACARLGTFQLNDCIVYTSCEPCPMCLGAIYWARPDKIYFANSRKDAASINFDDDFIYQEIGMPVDERSIPSEQLMRKEGYEVFKLWADNGDKTLY
jgi:guanine deaminase